MTTLDHRVLAIVIRIENGEGLFPYENGTEQYLKLIRETLIAVWELRDVVQYSPVLIKEFNKKRNEVIKHIRDKSLGNSKLTRAARLVDPRRLLSPLLTNRMMDVRAYYKLRMRVEKKIKDLDNILTSIRFKNNLRPPEFLELCQHLQRKINDGNYETATRPPSPQNDEHIDGTREV